MTDPKILAENPDFRITFHAANRQHDPLVVTFAGQPGQMADRGFGTDFALRNGFDTVYVAQRFESHFQGLDLETFQRTLAPYAAGRRVVCYGSSLGAYAALYYGGTIDADILAGAPMLPSWTGFDHPKYRDLPRTHIPLTDIPKSTDTPIIVTDPMEPPDVKFMQGTIWPAFPNARIIKLPYAGHTVFKSMQDAGVLSTAVLKMFKTGNAPIIELPTEGFPSWHVNFGNANMRRKEWGIALHHGQAAFAIAPGPGPISLIIRAANAQQNKDFIRQFVSKTLTPDLRARFVDKVPVLKRMVAQAFKA